MDLSDEFCDKCKDKAKILQILAFEEGIEEGIRRREVADASGKQPSQKTEIGEKHDNIAERR